MYVYKIKCVSGKRKKSNENKIKVGVTKIRT